MKKIEKCLNAQQRAKQRIAGINHLLSKRPDQFSLGVWPSYFKKAQGVEVWDLDDNKYIDMSIGGIGATVLGYADTDVDKAVKSVIDNGIASSLNAVEEVELAELLCELHPWADKARFTRTGGEAMTVAIRLARAATNNEIVLFCGYHGWHDWYLAANISSDNLQGHLLPGLLATGVPSSLKDTAFPFEYNNIESLTKLINLYRGKIAAIVMEPIRNISPVPDFLPAIRTMASNEEIPLIFDEISSGFRMNSAGAHQLFNIEPDIAVFSKALGNGYPIGAVIGIAQYMDSINHTFISSTCWTERTGTSAALATVKKHIKHNVGEHLMAIGKLVQQGWLEIANSTHIPIIVGGIYPLSHFEFNIQGSDHLVLKAYYVQEMLKQGFLASNIFYAMYAHTTEHVNAYLSASLTVFEKIKSILANNESIEMYLEGEPAVAGFKRMT